MGGLFKQPKAPAPDPEIAKSQKRQEDLLKKQELRAKENEKQAKKKIQARVRARRYAGTRLLMGDRANAGMGLKDTLGV